MRKQTDNELATFRQHQAHFKKVAAKAREKFDAPIMISNSEIEAVMKCLSSDIDVTAPVGRINKLKEYYSYFRDYGFKPMRNAILFDIQLLFRKKNNKCL